MEYTCILKENYFIEGEKLNNSSGKIWPYAISASIILVFGFCVTTIVVTGKAPVQNSDTYMMGYHEADDKANELIEARIAFDKKYKIEYVTDGLNLENSLLKYKITDLDLKPVNDAEILVVLTRPNTHKNDKELLNPSVEDGVYTFASTTLPEKGRWDVMAKIKIGENERFYNVKADTRVKEAKEY